MIWRLCALSAVAAQAWFIYAALLRSRRFWAAPVWCAYAVPALLLNSIWALGSAEKPWTLWWALRSTAMVIFLTSSRIAITCEAIGLLVFPAGNHRARLECSIGAGALIGSVLYFSSQSPLGRVRIGCTVAVGVAMMLSLWKPHGAFLLARRHIVLMFLWLGSAALASANHVLAGEPGDAAALAVQAACVWGSAWIFTRRRHERV